MSTGGQGDISGVPSEDDALVDSGSISSAGVEDFLASQGILSPSPIRGAAGEEEDGGGGSSECEGGEEEEKEEILSSPSRDAADATAGVSDMASMLEDSGDDVTGGGASASEGPLDMSHINSLLKDHGFERLGKPQELAARLAEVLEVVKHRGETIDGMSADVNSSFELQGSANHKAEELSRLLEVERRAKATLSSRNVALEESVKTLKKRAADEIRKLKQSLSGVERKLAQTSHKVKAKDLMIEKLTDKLNLEATKERESLEHSRNVFKALSSRPARKASPADSKALKVISMYEANKDRMEEELDQLRGEVRQLNEALRDKENVVMKNEFTGYAGAVDGTMERMAQRYKDQERQNRALLNKEASFTRNLAKLENKLVSTREQLKATEDENTNLLLELQSRPTVKQYKASERRIDELERKLYSAVTAAQESADVRELKRHMGTKALIEQDKTNHRLRLERLDAIPREISKEILKQTCRELEINDVTLIAPCVRKMSKAMLLLPRLERFVNDVCGFVFKHSDAGADEGGKGSKKSKGGGGGTKRNSMEEVMPVLSNWEKQLSNLGKSNEFRAIVVGELCRRSVVPSDGAASGDTKKSKGKSKGIFGGMFNYPGATPEMSDEQALRAVRDLVELEKAVMARCVLVLFGLLRRNLFCVLFCLSFALHVFCFALLCFVLLCSE